MLENETTILKRRMMMFERAAITLGISNFDKEDNVYTDPVTLLAFRFYNRGWNCGKTSKGTHYVIGSIEIDDPTQTIKFSDRPYKYVNLEEAEKQQMHLVRKYRNKIFIIYTAHKAKKYSDKKAKPTNVNTVDNSLVGDVGDKPFKYADDGFGNLIKLSYKNYLSVIFGFFNNEVGTEHFDRIFLRTKRTYILGENK